MIPKISAAENEVQASKNSKESEVVRPRPLWLIVRVSNYPRRLKAREA